MSDFIEKQYSKLIDRIYSAALDPNNWRSTLHEISEAFDGATCAMFVTDPDPNALPFVVDWGMDQSAVLKYAEHYIHINPYPEAAVTRFKAGEARCAAECVDKNEALRSEFFNEWMNPNGWGPEHIGGVLYNDEKRIGILALAPQIRDAEQRLNNHLQNLSLLTPHIVKAFQINATLAQSWNNKTSLELFAEQIKSGAFILDHEDRIIHLNSKARKILARHNILKMDASGKLYATDLNQNNDLQSTLLTSPYDLCPARTTNILRLSTRSTQTKLLAWVLHHNTRHIPEISSRALLLDKLAPAVRKILIVKELHTHIEISSEILQVALNLTPAEAKIVSALASGQTLYDYAGANKVSKHTVRKQLTQIFTKLGVSSQPQLMSLVANLRDLDEEALL